MGNFARNSVFFMRVYPGILSILLVLVSACNRQYDARLTDIETYINDRPDSALAVVTAIDPADLHTRRDKALHSLVYSMALDKCYIDTTDVSVVQPAFDYFRHHGSADYRLKAVYYRARIAENAGDIDLAKEILVRYGDKYIDKAQDLSFAGKYLLMHCILSKIVFDFDSAIQYAHKAKDKYELINEARGFTTACFGLSNCYISICDNNAAKSVLSEIKTHWTEIDDYRKCSYYHECIVIALDEKDIVKAESLVLDCLAECSGSLYMPWVEIMDTYMASSKWPEAMAIMQRIEGGAHIENFSYYTMKKAVLMASIGDYRTAYELEHTYIDELWKKDKLAVNSNVRNVKSRYESEAYKSKSQIVVFLLLILLLAVLILSHILFQKLTRRRQQSNTLYSELEEERKELLELRKQVDMSKEYRDVVDERYSLLNKILLSHKKGRDSVRREQIAEMDRIVDDRKTFVSSIAMLFSVAHPKFILALRSAGLTDMEIGYCCLLVQGLSGKEISSIFSLPRFYNSSSEIRAKLGLSNRETNLNVYLKGLLPLDN